MAPTDMINLLMTAIQAVVFYAVLAVVIWKVIRIEHDLRQIKNLLELIRLRLEREP